MQIPCPHCGKPINPAALLAVAGRGHYRQFTAKERERRKLRLARVRGLRWKSNESSARPTGEVKRSGTESGAKR